MKITLAELQEPIACIGTREFLQDFLDEIGLDEFPEMPDGWTKMHQAMMLSHPVMRQWWGTAVSKGLIPAWSMYEADLRGALNIPDYIKPSKERKGDAYALKDHSH